MDFNLKFIDGGVTAPNGFTASGYHCGIKAGRTKNDTALIYSEKLCNAAGVFTSNRVKAESVKYTKKILTDGKAQAAIVNVGYANACTGEQGAQVAKRMADCTAKELGINCNDVIVCSTGIIGQQVPVEKIEANISNLKAALSKDGHTDASIGIMTTDTQNKECAVEFDLDGKTVRIGAMCKGSGMIHINMGTMLCFVTTDCAISSKMLDKALHESISGTYNCVSVDGDTSTNDTLTILANGLAGNKEIKNAGKDYEKFLTALNALNKIMAMKIAADGEGASRLVECTVKGAKDIKTARGLAKEIIRSNLVKAAMFGKDANCGRILCAMGYSGFEFNPDKTCVYFSSKKDGKRYFEVKSDGASPVYSDEKVEVVHNGVGLSFDEEKAAEILSSEAVEILVELSDGKAEGQAWGCDLTYDYVKINGDYRS
ncbi:MAG: bifunctional glutamate N-acetyltransferase/amino-acid acetyltransferase ArgJ [Treponema sp.]|uniref:bifunctional glutamate N-acetyltransferase/amino-acid acetyltransferase ArgJ n=1 Tax=Treponema sp. TaxID=166 RepID=UPI001B5877DE|nr:bifunctional glutamate N-acetyltransferase/amino-acid acetyltransferase ArgJ [Treponema sp.]MBP5401546.1 bifunctional glutamate N-acetyltransferase/amino-acid acetyltransferase ArgJ [Treponema sp.]MBR5932930.1 bifunctional glutamate N-acetyltransferase/amino-acid acetyltransferase ArgJ [Treponema sp.]